MMESGYVTLQCDELSLALRKMPAKDLVLRLDAEFVNGYNVFKWTSNGDVKYSSSKFTPVLQSSDNAGTEENQTFNYINGFDNLVLKSNFVDLSSEVISGLANASLKIAVVQINEVAETAPPAKAAKGAPPPVAAPSEEALLSLTIPFSSLIQTSSGVIQVVGSHADSVYNANVDGDQSYLNFTLSADNNMAEYVMGSTLLNWSGARLVNAPASWGLHFADVIDPKAKVPPTADELRKKYLEGISKLMDTQEKVATFQLSIGGEGVLPVPPAAAIEDGTGSGESEVNTADRSLVQQMIVKQTLENGVLSFDKEAAAAVPASEDIRSMSELWSITWGPSAGVFLHRAEIRKLVALLEKDPANGVLPLTVKKTPTNEFMAAEGGELFATALVDISSILKPDTRSWSIGVPVTGADFSESVPYEFTVTLASSGVLKPKPALQALADKISNNGFSYGAAASASDGSSQPAVAAAKTVSTLDNNKSALDILRADITKAIERVAQEYLTLYPIAAEERRPTEEGATGNKTVEGKKIEFLNYLTTNGIFNELKEHLKTSVELIIREQFGDRGRALSAGLTVGSEFAATVDDSNARLEAVLSELYVFLMKECSMVLNSLFSDTLIDRQKSELEMTASIRDEEETILQHLSRLSNQADDCAADSQFPVAESLHLECIHHINQHPSLGSNLAVVHEVYSRYGDFLLTFYASTLRNRDGSVSTEFLDGILQRVRDALYSAVCSNTSNWRVALLYAAVLVEVNQQEQSEAVLHQVLSSQLSEGKYALTSFSSEFDGYESDKMCPVDPRCYSVLAGLFSLQGLTLKCRKALRLANRSFAEGGYTPPLSTHGSPRRTLVLTLADTATHLLSFGLRKLGDACLQLAKQCEADVTEKAAARGKAATTVPHIKHLLKRAEAMSLVFVRGDGDSSGSSRGIEEERAMESVLCAEEPEDLLHGWLTVAAAVNPQDSSKLIEAYLSAVERLGDIPLSTPKKDLLPLSAFVHLGKLLITSGRWKEASTVLLYGATFYSSASLFLMLGVCYLRLDQQVEAEEALMASSTLNNKSPQLWAYFCLLNLAVGPTRHIEAERCMLQSLRLGLTDVLLLREMATAYIAVDKLQTAEDLIRRALVSDKRSALTRRLLGDVLAGQNQAVRAIDEYQAILSEEGGPVDDALKLETAEKCANLLISIGRDDDVKTLRGIMASIARQ